MAVSPSPESPVPGSRPSLADRALSSGAVALLCVLALSGAALDEKGAMVGVPSAGALFLSGLAGALMWASGVSGLLGFLLPAAALFIGAAFAPASTPLLLFSGRPLLAFVFAGLILAVASAGRRPPKWLLLPVFFALYAGVSYEVQTRVGPDGDEPQYLMVTESLIRDHDLVLDQDFREARYQAFFSRPLKPDFRIRGPEGQIYSLHAVGLSILILPAYWAFGYAGASFFMAFLAALLVRELRRLVSALTGDEALAEGASWLIGLSPPVIHFAGLVFTEIPAALLLCLGLRAASFGRTSRSALVAAACASALPWLNVRYAILALAVAGALAWRLLLENRSRSGSARFHALLPPALILIGSALALGLYHHALWGFFDPRRVYGRRREFSLDVLPEGLPGLFFDQEFGLLVYAPIFVLSLAGFFQLYRLRRSLALAGLFAVFGVIATASVWPMWRGGFNPPGRFLVPLVSLLAVTLALALKRGLTPATALLAGWGLWCGLGGAMNIEAVHRDRDGVAPFFRTQSGAVEWTSALPSFVLREDRPTRILLWPWAALLALPLVGAIRGGDTRNGAPENRAALIAAFAFIAVAALALRLSPRTRSPEREATRLVGLPCLGLPSLRYDAECRPSWALDLFYEPHRAPLGLMFARAVRLDAGRYQLALEASDPMGGPHPTVVTTDHRTGKIGRWPMDAAGTAPSLTATLTVDAPGEIDLSLVGGGPISLVKASLERLPR